MLYASGSYISILTVLRTFLLVAVKEACLVCGGFGFVFGFFLFFAKFFCLIFPRRTIGSFSKLQADYQITFSPDTCLAYGFIKGIVYLSKFLHGSFESFDYFHYQFYFGKRNLSLLAEFCGVQQLYSAWHSVQKRAQRQLLAGLLLAEELSAVSAVVTPLSEWKADWAARAAVSPLVLHPVICCRPARLIAHGPAEHSASTIPNQNSAVIPARKKQKRSCNESGTVTRRHQWPILHM